MRSNHFEQVIDINSRFLVKSAELFLLTLEPRQETIRLMMKSFVHGPYQAGDVRHVETVRETDLLYSISWGEAVFKDVEWRCV
jgi:hypothetical protein